MTNTNCTFWLTHSWLTHSQPLPCALYFRPIFQSSLKKIVFKCRIRTCGFNHCTMFITFVSTKWNAMCRFIVEWWKYILLMHRKLWKKASMFGAAEQEASNYTGHWFCNENAYQWIITLNFEYKITMYW